MHLLCKITVRLKEPHLARCQCSTARLLFFIFFVFFFLLFFFCSVTLVITSQRMLRFTLQTSKLRPKSKAADLGLESGWSQDQDLGQ